MTFTWQLPDGRTVRTATPKEKSQAVRALLKQLFPGVTFSVTTESRGTAWGHTRVRWNADRYPQVVWEAVRMAILPFADDAPPSLVNSELISYPSGIWCGPTRNKEN